MTLFHVLTLLNVKRDNGIRVTRVADFGSGTSERGRAHASDDDASGHMKTLMEAVQAELSATITTSESVRGGDVSTAFRCDLADGSVVFVKTHTDPPSRFFTSEATSLEWLDEAGARVPKVMASSDEYPARLVLQWVQPGRSTREGDADFGRMLARLHQQSFPCFGRPDSLPTGSRGLPNAPSTSWQDHYGQQRLLPLVTIGLEDGSIPPETGRQLRIVAESLEAFAGPPEPPSLLHGDLWAGNRIVDAAGRSWMIDPASFGGHREFDLAMMRLFGGYGPDCFSSYQKEFPLADGWEDRVLLHQLAPLAVHAIKFGGHYVGALDDALETLLARTGLDH